MPSGHSRRQADRALRRLSGPDASVGALPSRAPDACPLVTRPTSRRLGALVALALSAAALLAACGGGSAPSATARAAAQRDPAAPAAGASAAVTPCTPRPGRTLDGAGPFAVQRVHGPLARPVAGSSTSRRIDPTMWFPTAAATAAARGCQWRLILLSHGVASSPDRYARLAVHLASQGFVVLGPHHPDGDSRGFDEGSERVDDLSYLLDHLALVEQRLAPRLRGRIDGQAVGVAGHSFGAFSAAALTARDPRVKAAMIMAGGADPSTAAAIRVPTLAVAGGADPLVSVERVRGFADSIPPSTPHALAVIAGAGHVAYGNRCVQFGIGTCNTVARTASAMFLTYLAGLPGDSAPIDPGHAGPGVTITAVHMPPA